MRNEQLLRRVFDAPLDEQPDFIVADSGALLLAAYAFVRNHTQRGSALAGRPLLLLALTDSDTDVLRGARCPFELVHGGAASALRRQPRATVILLPQLSASAPAARSLQGATEGWSIAAAAAAAGASHGTDAASLIRAVASPLPRGAPERSRGASAGGRVAAQVRTPAPTRASIPTHPVLCCRPRVTC